jgi:hypothetical protein
MVQADPDAGGAAHGGAFSPKVCVIDPGYWLGHEDLPGVDHDAVTVTGTNFTAGPDGIIPR